jgi:hypothetical protein
MRAGRWVPALHPRDVNLIVRPVRRQALQRCTHRGAISSKDGLLIGEGELVRAVSVNSHWRVRGRVGVL